jgi:hypothetical protein
MKTNNKISKTINIEDDHFIPQVHLIKYITGFFGFNDVQVRVGIGGYTGVENEHLTGKVIEVYSV